jgi:hypothetical protein
MIADSLARSTTERLARGLVSQSTLFFRSSSGVFVCVALLCNLIAFVASTNLPPGYVELDQMVRPGSALSLAQTEGFILAVSVLFFLISPRGMERIAIQSLVSGFLTADAVNDVVLRATSNNLLATEFSWAAAATLPMMAFLAILDQKIGDATGHRQGPPQDREGLQSP